MKHRSRESEFKTKGLPKGWIKTTLETTSQITLGRSPPSSTYNKMKKGLSFYQGKADFGMLHPTPRVWCVQPQTLAEKNDILMSVRAPVGSLNISTETCGIGRGLAAIRPEHAVTMYIFYQLRYLENQITQLGTGTTFKAITGNQVRTIPVIVPPLPEQRRIVVKIESIFAQIDACRERLEQLTATTSTESSSLAQLKSSVLKQAFEGKLIPQDPNDDSAEEFLQKIHQDSRQELVFEKNGLPRGWIKTKMGNLVVNSSVDIVDGPFGSNLKATEYVEMGIPLIRLQNVARNQFVNKNIKYITKDKAESLKRHSFKVNDIIITKLGKPLGESCLVPNYLPSGIIVADIVRVRISHDLISRKFLVYAINSDQLARQFVKYTKGTTRPRVNLTKIRELMIPLPPLPEQRRIVSKIESIFARIDATDQLVRDSLIRLDLLKKSVLRKAFEGRLVPQDPRDEPIEILLQRIKREQKPRKNRNVK